jgi:hypothetical protein
MVVTEVSLPISRSSLTILAKCIGDLSLIEQAATNQLAAIACPISRFFGQVNWIFKHKPAFLVCTLRRGTVVSIF